MPDIIQSRVESVSVEWLLQNLTDSADGYNKAFEDGVDYIDMLRWKTRDHQFGPLVGSIMNSEFTTPILIHTDKTHDFFQIQNGHHRLCAAILLCLDSVNVIWDIQGESPDYHTTRTAWRVSSGDYKKFDAPKEWNELGSLDLWGELSYA